MQNAGCRPIDATPIRERLSFGVFTDPIVASGKAA
ncbi:hypothetical protein B1M_17040 [Burkholderia sp. TJI49]|nr:hypothetical protein B1M_17040 [Burkholderia sp. TJI49]